MFISCSGKWPYDLFMSFYKTDVIIEIPVGFSITIPPGGDLFIPKSILIKESAGIVMSIGAKFASTFQCIQ